MVTRNQRRRAMNKAHFLDRYLRREGLRRVPKSEGFAIDFERARRMEGILVCQQMSGRLGVVTVKDSVHQFQFLNRPY